MKLLVLSDLHLELGTSLTVPPDVEFDVVVLAGDIGSPGRKVVAWAQRESTFAGKPVILVAGNHEFYGTRDLAGELEEMRRAASGSNVHLLERDAVVIDGVRFVGCVLWTDFQLPMRVGDELDTNIELALRNANLQMNDFKLIQVTTPATRENRYRELKRLLRAEDTLSMHWRDRDWLRRELKRPFAGETVVVTHHAPSRGSVAAEYQGDGLTPAFVSDLPESLFEVPLLWVHGHTHVAVDYMVGGCRVLSNPRGYRMKDSSYENNQFDAGLVVELPADGWTRWRRG